LSKTSFNCSNVGANQVTLTVTDLSGNTNACTAMVTVTDNVAPTLVCKNATLPVTGTTALSPALVFNEGASFDNCSSVNLVGVTPSSFTCSNTGANTVTLTVADNSGNTATCQATVTVQGPIVSAVTTPEDCGQLNGTMAITVQNFVGQPAYSVNGGASYQLSNTFSNLGTGTYQVVVNFIGSNNCITPAISVQVGENVPVNTFTGAGDGINWINDLNWSLKVKPTNCHHVVIPAAKSAHLKSGQIGLARSIDVDLNGVLTVDLNAVLTVEQ
jgi:hypothetical protein